MDTSFQPELQASYYQHKAAKLASYQPVAFDITWNNSIGNQEKYYSGNLGSFDNQGDRLVMQCFNGSRDKQRGTSNTNQNISCSFDPSSMLCITCTSEHDVIPPRVVSHHKPISIAFGDQNFLACQPTDTGDCIRTIRLENSSLLELADIALELFEYSQPPPGTVMLFCSLSHLVRVGTSIYASQWVMLVNKVGIRWPGVKICPLPFILAHEIIGSAGSNMTELACWYSMVYSGDTQGLKDTLELLLKQVNKNSRNIQPLRYEESYCIPLPTSLSMQRDNNSTSVCAQDIHSHQRYSLCGYGVHGDCPLSQTRARQRFLCQPEPTGLPVKGHGASPC